jgi:hypothetical protein
MLDDGLGAPLPFLDEHEVVIAADVSATWESLVQAVDSAFSNRRAAVYAGLVGCEPAVASGRPLAAGSTMPGFRVASAVPGEELRLAGRHRFSAYALTFRVEGVGDGRSRLRAESRAAFPGCVGGTYHALVVRSGAHAALTRRLLATIRDRAEAARRGAEREEVVR